MDNMLRSIADHAPNLVALIIVVMLFLKYITKRDEAFKSMNDENNDARRHSREVIERCTEVMGEVVNELKRK